MGGKRKRQGPQGAGNSADKPKRPPTEFEGRLYKLCKCIPSGKVTTYGTMAEVLHSSARAVGQALRRNPFAPVVPCHRVVAADRYIGGFCGTWGTDEAQVQRKRRMLEEEGVSFEGHYVVSGCMLGAEQLGVLYKGAAKQDTAE